MSTDAMDTHVAELARSLRGPGRVRRSMLTETRDGLYDAAAAYRDAGLPPELAAARAVGDFGTVAELAPLYQDELTARQGRRTAVLVGVLFPAVVLGWELLWRGGVGWKGPSIPMVRSLAQLQDTVGWGVGAAALMLVLLTFHRGLPPRWLAVAAATVGATGVVLCGVSSAIMILASGAANTALLTTDPVAPIAYGFSAAALAITTGSATRTLTTALRSSQPPRAA